MMANDDKMMGLAVLAGICLLYVYISDVHHQRKVSSINKVEWL